MVEDVESFKNYYIKLNLTIIKHNFNLYTKEMTSRTFTLKLAQLCGLS